MNPTIRSPRLGWRLPHGALIFLVPSACSHQTPAALRAERIQQCSDRLKVAHTAADSLKAGPEYPQAQTPGQEPLTCREVLPAGTF